MIKILSIILFTLLVFGCKSDKHDLALDDQSTIDYAIVYNVLLDTINDNYEIFAMDLNGDNKTNISNLSGVEWVYASVGENLLFISDVDTTHRYYYLHKMHYDGKNRKKISDIRLNDSWMGSRKDGTELIIRPHSSIDTAFFIIDLYGKTLDTLKPPLPYLNDPIFSPDGKKIVFRGAKKPFKIDVGYMDELYIMDEDGSDLKQLTNYPISDTTAQWYSYHAGPPRWHPTEGFISYGSFQNGKYSLFGISPDSKKQWVLFENEYSSVYHDWSPDGKWLVYGISKDGSPPYHIALTNWETKETTILTDSTGYQFHQAPVFVLRSAKITP